MKAGRQACTQQAAQGLDSLASKRGKAGWDPFQDTVRVGWGTVCQSCLAQLYGWFLIPDVHAFSYTLTEPATSLCFCPSRFCKSYSVRKRTHRLILKAFGMLKRFPTGCITYSHPPPLPKPASFLRQKTQHKGTRQPKGNWSDGWFSDGAIVSPVSRLPPHLHAPDFQFKAMHSSVNAQKPKATHQEAPASVLKSSWASAKVQLPPTPPPTPLGLLSKPAKDSRARDGTRDHKLTPLLRAAFLWATFTPQNLISYARSCCTPILGAVYTRLNRWVAQSQTRI